MGCLNRDLGGFRRLSVIAGEPTLGRLIIWGRGDGRAGRFWRLSEPGFGGIQEIKCDCRRTDAGPPYHMGTGRWARGAVLAVV